MAVRVVIREPVPERTTQFITAVIRDELGVGIPASMIDELLLTLYALDEDRTVINDRDKQSILNEYGGAVDEQGNLSLELAPADNAIVDDTVEVEEHVLLFEFTYDSASKEGKQELLLKVVNLEKVPVQATP